MYTHPGVRYRVIEAVLAAGCLRRQRRVLLAVLAVAFQQLPEVVGARLRGRVVVVERRRRFVGVLVDLTHLGQERRLAPLLALLLRTGAERS